MEIIQKVHNLLIGLSLIGLCSAAPILFQNTTTDNQLQFFYGLLGAVFVVCAVVCLAFCLCCQGKNGFKEFHNRPVLDCSTSSLDHGLINPIANREFTIFNALSPSHHNNNIFFADSQIIGQPEIDCIDETVDFHLWFDGKEKDFPRTKLKYIKELGKGWFGSVVEGTAQGVNGNNDVWLPVTVRILEASATSRERAVFLHDALIYCCGSHPHILQLLGRSLESVPLLLLQEFCPRGDLKRYLIENRRTFDKLLSNELPLNWCYQLSSALKHLHENKLPHPDLAARNCQLAANLDLKLGDYGLSASLYPEDYYEGAPAVPVRWCSPESLTYTSTTIQPRKTTVVHNVWSFGVTMWEIYTYGTQPYSDLNNDDVISQVLGSSGVRLQKPKISVLYIDYVYRLMQFCWSPSDARPSIIQIHLMLKNLLQIHQDSKNAINSQPSDLMEDFDTRWKSFKPNSIKRTDNHEFAVNGVDLTDITVSTDNREECLLTTKSMSPSLNNLHGSLDNLTGEKMDSWLQKVANKTGDMSYVRGLCEVIKDLDNTLALENVSSSDSSPLLEKDPETKTLDFKLGPTEDFNKIEISSESETEDENWRKKIELGVYSEKVHQKSKSVTDLMVLTHIDCSESDSETPLPSLDYRVNYRNVRYAPKQNLEAVSLTFGSEGNLLSIHDKFQQELKKLQEERRDSLLFVPDRNSQVDNSIFNNDDTCKYVNNRELENLTSNNDTEALIEELSSPTKIQPQNQVFNIFNITVDTSFKPDLNEIINLQNTKDEGCKNGAQTISKEVPKLVDLIQSNDYLMDYIISTYECVDDPQSNSKQELNNNIKSFNDEAPELEVLFDTSSAQEETHTAFQSATKTESPLQFSSDFNTEPKHTLEYSLETWNNFLTDVSCNLEDKVFDNFKCQPSTSVFDNDQPETEEDAEVANLTTGDVMDHSFTRTSPNENTEIKDENWSPGEGWFLHPQASNEVSGEMESLQNESYVCFGMDDDIMTAIRNELLLKLPQAQGSQSEQIDDDEEYDSQSRSEVLIKYSTPLSPIPEESYSEQDSYYLICNNQESSSDSENDDWPEALEQIDSHSINNFENPTQEHHNINTSSQDSCCSNDTLFNLEELTNGVIENDKGEEHNLMVNLPQKSNQQVVQNLLNSISNPSEDQQPNGGDTNIKVLNPDVTKVIVKNLDETPTILNETQQNRDNGRESFEEKNDALDYDALTDIRFTGPSDVQLMSTSFSESADIEEQDWDSGSDTRSTSSSSGEFIWKEGEHEESVKALRAVPQDLSTTEKTEQSEGNDDRTSDNSSGEDEAEGSEFVPSAWDKYAIPTKSALRSPEKTLEKEEAKHKKSKGVWFKKQKYHCVYEYPREPESPSISTYELWKPTSLIGDWQLNGNSYIPPMDIVPYQHFPGLSTFDDDFFLCNNQKSFEDFNVLTSQFFPGQISAKESAENITPDSGVEDVTPSYFIDEPLKPSIQIQSLKLLAAAVVNKYQLNDNSSKRVCMGGLRYVRNKLKLDIPVSPNAFSSTKSFTIGLHDDIETKRQTPTFTTFGKSRFLVQQVDTPPVEDAMEKNVSFEALPYKPLQTIVKGCKAKVEVKGEASLLDSADEDSGIESSTLEHKKLEV